MSLANPQPEQTPCEKGVHIYKTGNKFKCLDCGESLLTEEQTPLREAIEDIIVDTRLHPVEASLRILALHHQRIQSLIDRLPDGNTSPVPNDEHNDDWERGFRTGFEYCLTEVRHLLEGELK